MKNKTLSIGFLFTVFTILLAGCGKAGPGAAETTANGMENVNTAFSAAEVQQYERTAEQAFAAIR